MNKKMSKRQRDIKSKLMGAVCMLLVSSIMMVSTTYAWFTLSTAPEVTGITTAVGANGNLEMALLPTSGDTDDITSDVGDSNLLPIAKNVTWGNLVDVSDTTYYGLNDITLYPSKLNATTEKIAVKDEDGNDTGEYTDGTTTIGTSPLATPQYGADGRVSTVEANTITGGYDYTKGEFVETAGYGVRAVGDSSSMTANQMAYRTAVGNASTYSGQALTTAKTSLNNRGSHLADIAIKHALGNDADGYTAEEIGYLQGAIGDLNTAIGYMETALKNYIIAESIAPATVTDDNYKAIVDAITAAELSTIKNGTPAGAVVSTGMSTLLTKLSATKSSVASAKSTLDTLSAGCTWSQISPALNLILDSTAMQVNGLTIDQIKAEGGQDALVDAVIDNGMVIDIYMYSGAGAYADLADFGGQYQAAITVTVSYGSLQNKSIPANMYVQNKTYADGSYSTTTGTPYLSNYRVAGFDSAGGDTTSYPISEFYGYIIDLAFRTNAANSHLMLQVDAVDRIYSDSNVNESTMGGGANMTFTSASTTFTATQVKSLMSNIKMVLFDTDSREVITYAKLNMEKSTTADTGAITAPIMLTNAAGVALADDDTTTVNESIAIMELDQNEVHQLSILVYLDGEHMANADVAADQVKSMSGSMNLQFASSATLKPMEYSDLKSENGGSSSDTVKLTNVTVPNGYTLRAAYYQDNVLAFAMNGDLTDKTVKVSVAGEAAVEAKAGTYMGVPGYGVTLPVGTSVEANTAVVITVEGGTTTYTVTLDSASAEGVGLSSTNAVTEGEDYTFTLTGTAEGVTYTVTYSMGTTTDATLTADEDGSYTISDVGGNITVKVVADT